MDSSKLFDDLLAFIKNTQLIGINDRAKTTLIESLNRFYDTYKLANSSAYIIEEARRGRDEVNLKNNIVA